MKRSVTSAGERSEKRGMTLLGETRTCPGRRGLRLTSAKEWAVMWKTFERVRRLLVTYVGPNVVESDLGSDIEITEVDRCLCKSHHLRLFMLFVLEGFRV